MSPTQKNSLTETLDTIRKNTKGDEISFHDIVKTLNNRGFGTLLIAPSLLVILPTGAIPGMPALCAAFIVLISVQIVMGRHYPWLPKKLKQASFKRETYINGVKKIKPYTCKIDRFFKPRFKFLTHRLTQRFIAFLCVLLSIAIAIIAIIPFAAAIPALAILLFGLGLSVKDGLVTGLGLAVFIATAVAVPVLLLS